MARINVTRASVIIRDEGRDLIALYLDADPLFPALDDEACADLSAANGTGVAWVRKNIGIEPEIIDIRGREKMKFGR